MHQAKEQITFVCCIEHGRLEKQTILMAETFRANAGQFANCRLIAVVARKGASLSVTTLAELKKLNVEVIYSIKKNAYAWFHYANKIEAVAVAQQLADTPLIVWLDSDLLFVNEPHSFLLKEDEDFAASLEFFPPAVVENVTTYIPYWKNLCKLVGIAFDEVPNVTNIINASKVQKLYFTSGLFVWRKDSNFANTYKNVFFDVLKNKYALHNGNFFQNDQVILSPVIVKEKLRWRLLDQADQHITLTGQIVGENPSKSMKNTNVLHYSGSLNHPFKALYLNRLQNECPKMIKFIQANDNLILRYQLMDTMTAHLFKLARKLKWYVYGKKVLKASQG